MEQSHSQLMKCRRIPPCGIFRLGGRYRLLKAEGENLIIVDSRKSYKTFSSKKGTPYYIGTFFQETDI